MAYLQILAQRCDNGRPLINATVSDNHGTFAATDTDGSTFTGYAYVGYRITVFWGGRCWPDKTHIVTQEDLDRGYVVICLEETPGCEEDATENTDKDGPGICSFAFVMGQEFDQEHPDSVPSTLRRLRRVLNSTTIGRQLVEDYHNEEVSSSVIRILGEEPALTTEAFRLIIGGFPIIHALAGRTNSSLFPSDFIVPDHLVERTLSFSRQLREHGRDQSALMEALDRLDQFVEASRCQTVRQLTALLNQEPRP